MKLFEQSIYIQIVLKASNLLFYGKELRP